MTRSARSIVFPRITTHAPMHRSMMYSVHTTQHAADKTQAIVYKLLYTFFSSSARLIIGCLDIGASAMSMANTRKAQLQLQLFDRLKTGGFRAGKSRITSVMRSMTEEDVLGFITKDVDCSSPFDVHAAASVKAGSKAAAAEAIEEYSPEWVAKRMCAFAQGQVRRSHEH